MENSFSEEIDKAEKVLSSMSITDANMRLILNMARLSDNVSSLSTTVSTLTSSVQSLTQDVNGVSGVRIEIKDTNRKVDNLGEKITRAEIILWRVVWVLCIIGLATILSDVRSIAPLLKEGLK